MNTIPNFATPKRSPTDFRGTSISFNNQQVPGLEVVSIELFIKKLDLMNLIKVQKFSTDVGNTQERVFIVDGAPLGLLLNSASHFCYIAERDAYPIKR